MPGDEHNDWIITYTGRRVYPFIMRAEDIDLRDIAHALAMKCRFSGHCKQFYSVAQHSVLMARFDLPGTATWRLLHDASEAYLPDIASPIKHRFPEIIEAERNILRAVRERFRLPYFDHDEVKKADFAMCIWEGRRLFGPPSDDGPQALWWRRPDPMPDTVLCSWEPYIAEREFLRCAEGLV